MLGIGIAGGGKSKDEGKALASRLTQMRKERNDRAKTTSATKTETSSAMGGGGPAGQMTLQGLDGMGDMSGDAMGEMEVITPGGGGGGGGGGASRKNKSNKKKKKKKKGKR